MSLSKILCGACVAALFALFPRAAEAKLATIAVAADASGRLDLFYVQGGSLFHRRQLTTSAELATASMIAPNVSGVAIARNADGRLETFYLQGTQIGHAWQTSPGGEWSAPFPFAGPAIDLSIVATTSGALDVFYAGADALLHDVLQVAPSAGWGPSRAVMIGAASELQATRNADGRLEVFWVDAQRGVINHRWQIQANGNWSGTAPFADRGANLGSEMNADGRLEFFYTAADGSLHHVYQTAPSAGWGGDLTLARFARTVATATHHDGRIEALFVDGFGNIEHAGQVAPSGGWLESAQLGWSAQSIAATKNADGRLEVFYLAADGSVFHNFELVHDQFWSGEYPLERRGPAAFTVDAFQTIVDPLFPGWHINDHTLGRDVNGGWQLVAIDAPNPGTTTNLFDAFTWLGRANAPALRGGWTRAGQNPPDASPVVASAAGRALWAPHIASIGSQSMMVYCDGDLNQPTAFTIAARTSFDGVTWSAPSTLFSDGYQARDPMLLSLGGSSGPWVLYYTATEFADQGHHVVAYRTSHDLVQWSDRQIAYMDYHWGQDYGPTESPFVVQRGPYFYLFIGPRPYDAPIGARGAPSDGVPSFMHPGYVGTDVFRSTSWNRWTNADYVGHIAAHAAEVVHDDDGSTFVTSAGIGQGGLKIARLHWLDGQGF